MNTASAPTQTIERLRELDDAAFASRYDCDRYTATVLSNRLEYLLDHVCTQLLQCAFSPMLRDLYDFGATVTGPRHLNYPTPVVGKGLACFTGTMTESVKNTIEEYGHQNLKPGDVIIANDPYRTGTHVNDVLFIRPIFFDGEVINFVTLKAHQLDIGGSVPGGFSTTKTSIYENGLVISPRTLVREGVLDVQTWSLIMDNARFGSTIGDDIKTIISCLDLGHELMLKTVAHYGTPALQGTTRYMVDADAERMAEALAELPDGEWVSEGLIDADGLDASEQYPIKVTLRKQGDRLEVDLGGSARQTRTSVNSTYLDTKTAVGVALKYLMDPAKAFTSGLYRNVDIIIPDGSIANALPPNGVVFMYGDATNVIISCIMRAFSQVLGENAMGGDYGSPNIHTATGLTPDGNVWVSSGVGGGERGPWGATKSGDADSYQLFFQANGLDLSVEISEVDAPVAVLSREYQRDSAGEGYHRGGAAVLKDTQWLAPAQHNITPDRVREVTGFGAHGAKPGASGGVWLWQDAARRGDLAAATKVAGVFDPKTGQVDLEGEYAYFGSSKSWPTPAGAVFRYLTNGGGGWGDPLRREPERVLRDVRDGYTSIEAARENYGVVITGDPDWDPEGLQLDLEATAALRRERVGG
ncbi:hydantoinase B/oxoprolinase family protein [Arthrobacter sulfonylureivorans]|uniref:Hydantoinase B/oxoprolinase family protein n=1 Tax=Arthrobacter sulfonylureivorans TaxID=2486855 RepID=A0ABY3WA40_9MICC|nr:hydantoinase B/oxoprolinase family protein [Arthrobacter sulfonylureivorans]UNK46070.1 hydantoinase B/oxoprolinase family protein [Arthrobacter sulfonylureivorans]